MMKALPAALIDYRLGWRWLLPFLPGQTLYLHGFGKVEAEFWQECMATAQWVEDPRQAEGLVLDTDGSTPEELEELTARLSTVQWIVCLGAGKKVNPMKRRLAMDFPIIREYGLLPATVPRVIIPISTKQKTVNALALHSPGRWAARLGMTAAAGLAGMGIFWPLRRRLLLLATRAPDFRPMGARLAELPVYLGKDDWDFALYLGTPEDNRKTVVLPLGGEAPQVIVKTGETLKARQSLQKEAEALAFFRRRAPGARGGLHGSEAEVFSYPICKEVPRMIGLVENEHVVALCQEYRPRTKVAPRVQGEAVVHFLARLSAINRRSRSLMEVLEKGCSGVVLTAEDAESTNLFLWDWLRGRAEAGAVVYECLSHGDFAPWNCSWTSEGLFVFDWEESQSAAMALGDAFYFELAPVVHVQGNHDLSRIMKRALDLARLVAQRGGLLAAEVEIHLAIWLFERAMQPCYSQFLKHLAKELACLDD